MTNSIIPTEAVEAAHKRVQHYIDDIDPAEFQDILKMALEAAAPHMLAEAALMRWKLDAVKKWADAMIEESYHPQYGRDVRTILEASKPGTHEPF